MAKRTKPDNGTHTRSTEEQRPRPDPERAQLIAEAAYFRAEQRGFSGGDPVADWLAAEKEILGLGERFS